MTALDFLSQAYRLDLRIDSKLEQIASLTPAAVWRFRDWLVDDNSDGIYGLAAGEDGVWTQFLCHGR